MPPDDQAPTGRGDMVHFEAMTVRLKVRVTGKVQGVFFRASCRAEAVRLGLSGFVRNAPDGSVEAAFEGDPDAVATMVEWCWRGPDRARVTAVETAPESPSGTSGFLVQ